MHALTAYIIPVALAAVALVLFAGLWNMLQGRQPEPQPDADALARGAPIHRALPRHGGDLLLW